MPSDPAYLQYGALGLLAMVLIGGGAVAYMLIKWVMSIVDRNMEMAEKMVQEGRDTQRRTAEELKRIADSVVAGQEETCLALAAIADNQIRLLNEHAEIKALITVRGGVRGNDD